VFSPQPRSKEAAEGLPGGNGVTDEIEPYGGSWRIAVPSGHSLGTALPTIDRDTVRKLHADDWTSIRGEVLERICPTLQVPVGELLIWHIDAQARSE
jgi:DNA-binding Xre family transcriptional regulator